MPIHIVNDGFFAPKKTGITNLDQILVKHKELFARREARWERLRQKELGIRSEGGGELPIASSSQGPLPVARPVQGRSPVLAGPSGQRVETTSNNVEPQHAIPDAETKIIQAPSPREHDPPNAPKEAPAPGSDETEIEEFFEHADLKTRLEKLDAAKGQFDQENSEVLKTLYEALATATVMRVRMRGMLEEGRRMRQMFRQCEREEAMLAGPAEDGERAVERVEESNEPENVSETQNENEKVEELQNIAEVNSSIPRVDEKRTDDEQPTRLDTQKSPSSLRKRARDDADSVEESNEECSSSKDSPTRASKKRRDNAEVSRATSQQVTGEPSGLAIVAVPLPTSAQPTANRDGPLVTPPAIVDERADVKHKGKGKQAATRGNKERETTPTPMSPIAGSSKSKGKRKADELDGEESFHDSPAKRCKNDTSLNAPSSPTRRLP